MASIGHVVVGIAAARVYASGRGAPPLSWLTAGVAAALSLAPDLDAIGFAFHVPYGAPFGHRGASHSVVAAAALALVVAVLARRFGAGWTFVVTLLAIASHGLLDAMTDGGLGVALLWPFTDARFFLPWRPIPVAPIGLGLLSRRGLEVIATESLAFAPLLAWACWPRSSRKSGAD